MSLKPVQGRTGGMGMYPLPEIFRTSIKMVNKSKLIILLDKIDENLQFVKVV